MIRSRSRAAGTVRTGTVGARIAGACAALALLAATPVVPSPAEAAGTDHVVIAEAYVNRTAAGAAYRSRFFELYNPAGSAVDLGGLSLQYRSASGSAATTTTVPLIGTIAAGGQFLLAGSPNSGASGADLPTPDQVAAFASSGSAGTVALVRGTTPVVLPTGSVTANADVVDLVGYGTSNTYETAAASGQGPALSLQRTEAIDTDDNATDFDAAAPTPTNAAGDGPVEPEPPTERTIAEIQGTTDASPFVGRRVITTGVVTAAYPTGGFDGFYLQTGGTGGDLDLAGHAASDAVFVYGAAATARVRIGDSVRVTGLVSEFDGLTEVVPASADDVGATEPEPAVKPVPVVYPRTVAQRESLEGMLLDPQGSYTVTDTYTTSQYGEIGLAAGTTPLYVPTELARPRTPERDAVAADNAARKVVLDDGASTSYVGASRDTPAPWLGKPSLTEEGTIRVGADARFQRSVVLDYRNKAWKLQPVQQLTADDADGVRPATFSGAPRPAAPEPVGGDVTLASFNVLNYFTTTGADYTAATGLACEYFVDRAGNPITVDSCTGGAGPRGAADTASLQRQQDKIVHAINRLDGDVVSLEEIENSAQFGLDRDTALAALTSALNVDAGPGTWDYVRSPSPDELPPIADQDLIRTAFIYHPAQVRPVGESTVLVGAAAFDNAREPLAQAFQPVAGTQLDRFVAIVNHFKSKGSGVDDGTGQGNANPDRVAQAQALVAFADAMTRKYGTDKAALTGDFNAYSMEDPVEVLKDAGYVDLEARYTDKETYQFGGEIGSLDHVYASPSLAPRVTGLDVWNINAFEPIGYEYSRYNSNALDLYDLGPYRASDHDPVLVGLSLTPRAASTTTAAVSPGIYGLIGPVVLARVTSTDAAPTGSVTVSEGDRVLATVRLGARGCAVTVLPSRALGPGPHRLTVRYSGDTLFAPSSATVTTTVARRR